MQNALGEHYATSSRYRRLVAISAAWLGVGLCAVAVSGGQQTQAPAGKLHGPSVVFKKHWVRFTINGYFEPLATIQVSLHKTSQGDNTARGTVLKRIFRVRKDGRLILHFRWPATDHIFYGEGPVFPIPWERDNYISACYLYPIWTQRCAYKLVQVHGAPVVK
jgi:hypothetical protein